MTIFTRAYDGTQPVRVEQMHGNTFNGEDGAHQFIITGVPTGTVKAYMMRADGTTCTVDGTNGGGSAIVTLNQDCYNVPGRFTLSIFVGDTGARMCVYACVGIVYRTRTETIIDSGDVVPSLDDIIDEYNSMQAAEASANAAAGTALTAASGIGDTQVATFRAQGAATSGAGEDGHTFTLGAGGVSPTGGANSSGVDLCRLGYIGIGTPLLLTVDTSEYQWCVWIYTAKSVGDKIRSLTNNDYTTGPVVIPNTEGAKYFRVGFKRLDGATVTEEMRTALAAQMHIYALTDTTLTTSGAAADAKTVGGELADLKSAIDEIDTAIDGIDTALAVKSISGKSLIFYDGVEKTPVAFSANIDYSQDGVPSPTNPIGIVGVSAINITHTYDGGQNSYAVQLPSECYKGELNLLNGELTQEYGKVILLSTQDWHYASPNIFWKAGPSTGTSAAGGIAGVCNYYHVVQKSSLDDGEMWINNSSYSSSKRIVIKDGRFSTLGEFTTWLASVEEQILPIVVYELNAPVTSELTPTDISLQNGYNVITSNTPLDLEYYVRISNHIDLSPKTINITNLIDGEDIANKLTAALNYADIVVLPAGEYTLSSMVNIPDNKTVKLAGDYHDTNIDATVITLTSDNGGFSLGTNVHFVGGKIYTNSFNARCFVVDCHKTPIVRTSIHDTMIVGDREKIPHIYTQVGVYIECDYADGETFTRYGYLMFCDFDLYIDMVGIAYHFHRITSPGTASDGVWMTENNIHGYIRHCNRYIWYDLASGTYANSNSTIDATLQAGYVYSGETVYPGINIFGSGITISGELWDFSAGHHRPAVYFESGSARNFVTSVGNIMDYNKEHSALTTNITLDELSRLSGYKKIPISIYQSESFDANDYISSLTNYSYRIGDIIYIYCVFKIDNAVTNGNPILSISDDAFIASYPARLVKQGDNSTICNVLIGASNPHIVTVKSNGASSSAWILLQAQCISDRIESY